MPPWRKFMKVLVRWKACACASILLNVSNSLLWLYHTQDAPQALDRAETRGRVIGLLDYQTRAYYSHLDCYQPNCVVRASCEWSPLVQASSKGVVVPDSIRADSRHVVFSAFNGNGVLYEFFETNRCRNADGLELACMPIASIGSLIVDISIISKPRYWAASALSDHLWLYVCIEECNGKPYRSTEVLSDVKTCIITLWPSSVRPRWLSFICRRRRVVSQLESVSYVCCHSYLLRMLTCSYRTCLSLCSSHSGWHKTPQARHQLSWKRPRSLLGHSPRLNVPHW